MEKYLTMAKDLKMTNAKLISPDDIIFDIRTILKCKWGCDNFIKENNIKCHDRGTTYKERIDIIKIYTHILLLHAHNARQLSVAALEIEKAAFLDGYYFASAIRCCSLCEKCKVLSGGVCPNPKKIRPCDQLFGIDVYKTARNLGLPINVLKEKDEVQNRYGFVLID